MVGRRSEVVGVVGRAWSEGGGRSVVGRVVGSWLAVGSKGAVLLELHVFPYLGHASCSAIFHAIRFLSSV